jgi:hypothetical protein
MCKQKVSEAMADWPDYVDYAFEAIEVLRVDEEYQSDFVKRWGDLDLATFARALREGDRREQQVSAFAIGYTESTWARNLLLPLLHSEYPEVRWAAALMLGNRREKAAFPVLIGMLQEFLPPNPPGDYDWYETTHSAVASILGLWGKREAVEPLRDTLAKLWRAELNPRQDRPPQLVSYYADAVVYALGQLETFDALNDLDISLQRKRFWTVTLVMGYLNAEHLYKKSVLQIIQDGLLHTNLGEFLRLASDLLREKLGMSPEEADVAVKNYDGHYFDRWEQQE